MKKDYKLLRVGLILTIFFFLQAGFTTFSLEITIDVAPNVINIQSQTPAITVHTNLPFRNNINCESVELNGVSAYACFSDDRGFFVAKFHIGEFENILEPGKSNLMELSGISEVDGEFYGSQLIKVIDVKASSNKK